MSDIKFVTGGATPAEHEALEIAIQKADGVMDLSDLTPEEEMTLRLCALYEQTTSIEEFCEALRLDSTDPAAIELYDRVHTSYVQIWTFLGNEPFETAMDERRHVKLVARTMLQEGLNGSQTQPEDPR